jgi:hypothetical protein
VLGSTTASAHLVCSFKSVAHHSTELSAHCSDPGVSGVVTVEVRSGRRRLAEASGTLKHGALTVTLHGSGSFHGRYTASESLVLQSQTTPVVSTFSVH